MVIFSPFARDTQIMIVSLRSWSASTMGARVFVGGEVSLASMPQLALSVDVGYYHQPEPFVGFEPGGMGLSFSGHWYVK